MNLLDLLIPTKKLPFHEDYQEDKKKWDFWHESYESDHDYVDELDAKGNPIIRRFECENSQDYTIRKQSTKVRNYCKFILNKYNASVYRNFPKRDERNIEDFIKNVDGYDNSLNDFMSEQLLNSQIYGESYFLIDTTQKVEKILTVAQQKSSDVRTILRNIPIENVVNICDYDGYILEIIILIENNSGYFARYFNETEYCDIIIDDKLKVVSVGDLSPHGYSSIPVIRVKPLKGAQIASIAESQLQVANLLSILSQEIFDSTFTKFILSGVRVDNAEDNQKITFSGKRILTLEEPNASLNRIGSDISQAQSIRDTIEQEEQSIFRTNGFGANSWSLDSTSQSGIAIALSREDFYLTCRKLTKEMERAESKLFKMIAPENAAPSYSDKYIADDFAADLIALRDIISLPVPNILKNKEIENFANKYYNLSPEEQILFKQEMLQRVN